MKSKLIFNLPEENYEFELACNGGKYKSILCELDNFLRSKLKYEDISDVEYEIYENTRTRLWDLINEENLDLY